MEWRAWRASMIWALAAGALAVAGCASRPPEPPKPIKLLAVLPAWAPVSEANAGFGSTGRPVVVVPIVTSSGSQGSGLSTGGAVAAGVLTSALLYGMQESKRKEREALAEALSHVNFDAAAEVDARLLPALEQSRIHLVRVTDDKVVWGVRNGKFEGLPEGVDAVLDVRITESGYYSSTRAGGYSPMLLLTATLLAPAADADTLDDFSYYADWRDAGKNRRWITTPKSMTFPTVELLKAGAADARAGLSRVVDEMVALLVLDLERHARGELRVD